MSEENIAQMRETIERLSKDKAGLEKTVAEQTTSLRVFEAREAFREAGYNPNNGSLYAAVHPQGDITSDGIMSFAEEQGLSPVSASTQEAQAAGQETTTEAAENQTALASMAGGGSRAGDPASGGAEADTLTRQEWQELYANDPAAAKAAVASGRVEISKDNVYLGNRLVPGHNPFVLTNDS